MEEQKAIPPYMDYDVRTEENTEEKNNDNWAKWDLPVGYEFRDKEGNVINTDTIKLVKKQPRYPKTYKECCEALGLKTMDNDAQGYKVYLIISFQELLIARDAYWKIAGEEMGLGKPWKPEPRTHSKERYVIITDENDILFTTESWSIYRVLLEFPTAEMRDAFFENFKELIEQCKEFL